MNSLLALDFAKATGMPGWGSAAFVLATLLSEGTLLVVAAQAGFIDGPRVLGYMAHDSWMPQWFANLSERLATYNGILLMGLAALAALLVHEGHRLVARAVLLDQRIRDFLAFDDRHVPPLVETAARKPALGKRLALFAFGTVVCLGILVTNVCMKLFEGGWMTVAVTSSLVAVAYLIHSYYRGVSEKLKKLDETLTSSPPCRIPTRPRPTPRSPRP